MWKISVVGKRDEIEKCQKTLKLTEFDVNYVEEKDFESKNFSDDTLAIVILPWKGYTSLFSTRNFENFLNHQTVVVLGSSIFFFDVEKWVIDGGVTFLSTPVNSIQLESVLNEISRIRSSVKDKVTGMRSIPEAS